MAPGLQDAGPTCRPAAAQLATQFRSGRRDADALHQRPAAKPDAVANNTARAGIEAVDSLTIAAAHAHRCRAAAAGLNICASVARMEPSAFRDQLREAAPDHAGA